MRTRIVPVIARVAMMIIASSAYGCAHRTVGTVPVSGLVLVDGEPLANASVVFFSDDLTSGAKAIHGSTDEEGRYELVSGAFPDVYRVIVKGFPGRSDFALPNLGDDGIDEGQLMAAAAAKSRRMGRGAKGTSYRPGVLPPIYTSPQQTVLRIEVPDEGTTTADFNLTLKDAAKNSIATSGVQSNVQ